MKEMTTVRDFKQPTIIYLHTHKQAIIYKSEYLQAKGKRHKMADLTRTHSYAILFTKKTQGHHSIWGGEEDKN